MIIVSTIALWGLVVWKLSPTYPWWFDLLITVVGAGVTTFVGRQLSFLRAFAENNPSLALTEGADVVQMKRIEAQSKARGPDRTPLVAGATLTTTAPVVVIRGPDGAVLPQEPPPEAISDAENDPTRRLKP